MSGFNELIGFVNALSKNLDKVDKKKVLIFFMFIFVFSLAIFPQSVKYGGGISRVTSDWIDISDF